VRGYGLKDSARVKGARGENVKVQVANAATPQEAAKIYPASYWTAMIQPPPMSELPARFKSQDEWLATLRNGCNHCHALGMPQTRIYTTAKDWDAMFLRAKSMQPRTRCDGQNGVEKMLADWGTRVAAGEVPPAPRGQPHRTQRRGLSVGLGFPRVLRARLDLDRQAQPDVVPARESLRGGSHRRR